jgi:hypothetical protein
MTCDRLSDTKSRCLVEALLKEFESRYKKEWEEERFTLFPYPCQTKRLGELDFDTIFFWKVYAQGYFARTDGDFFKTLADRTGSGPAMVRNLASLAPHKANLLTAHRQGLFASSMNEAVQAGRPGWKILGYAITASEHLANWYPHESKSYAAQWFCDCISRQWDGKWENLIEPMNSAIRNSLNLPNACERVSEINDFIKNKFVLTERHLPGVGPEMVSFFLRDWKDFDGWRYYWKHDTRNEAFWSIIASDSSFNLMDGHKDTVLAFLIRNLTRDELESGALAKINTAVYRIHRDSRTVDIQQIMTEL